MKVSYHNNDVYTKSLRVTILPLDIVIRASPKGFYNIVNEYE